MNLLNLTPMVAMSDNYTIREVRPDEQSAILTFLLHKFEARVEPSVSYFTKYEHEIDEAEKKILAEDTEKRFKEMLAKHLCYVAVHNESGSIAGVSLMSMKRNPKFLKTTDNHKKPTDSTSSKYGRSKIHTDFMNYVLIPLCENVDFFVKFPKLQSALDLAVLCVDSNYRGQGLATRLVHVAVRYAESKGIGLIYGLFTSPFSRKAAEKNGFQTFSNVDLLSLRDSDGNVIFKDSGSYVVSVMAKCLQSSSNDQGRNGNCRDL